MHEDAQKPSVDHAEVIGENIKAMMNQLHHHLAFAASIHSEMINFATEIDAILKAALGEVDADLADAISDAKPPAKGPAVRSDTPGLNA